MVWTQPMTFTAGAVLTAAQMNVHVRDNLMASEAAQIQQAQDYIVGDGYHQLTRRQCVHSFVANTETTKSTDFVDLVTSTTTAAGGTAVVGASTGPSVTVVTGTTAWVILTAHCQGSLALGQVVMGYGINTPTVVTTKDGEPAVTAETEEEETDNTTPEIEARDPSDEHSLIMDGLNAGGSFRRSYVDFLTDLTPGSNTFTCKYKVGSESNLGSFTNRSIIVIPM